MTDLEAINHIAALIHHGHVAVEADEAHVMATLEYGHIIDGLLETDPQAAIAALSTLFGHALNLAVFTAARAAQLAGCDDQTGRRFVGEILTEVIDAMRRATEG
jgi:hypothetical protein